LSKPPDTPEAAQEVLRYFLEHPHAADTAEGVARWRLAGKGQRWTLKQVKQALRWLVQEGYLKAVSKPYTGQIYLIVAEDLEKGRAALAAWSRKPIRHPVRP